MSEAAHDVAWAGVKIAPPITVYALTLNEWVAVATILYLLLQAAFLLRKWWKIEVEKSQP